MYKDYTKMLNNTCYYKRMRRRFFKRVIQLLVVFGISFYIAVLFFGDLKTPVVMHLTDLNRCPACYGVSLCPELYSNQILLDSSTYRLANVFNAKNIYYGHTKSNRRVVLKKLAHNWELNEFDSKLCKEFGLMKNCKPKELMNVTTIEQKIVDLVKYNLSWPETEIRKGLVICPYVYSLYDFVLKSSLQSDLVNVWTMLSINPEPIILEAIPKARGWPVPAFAGVCGRLEVVAHEGEPLTSHLDKPWLVRLGYAKKILNAAMDFTFKHDRFRFYLMDWSLDNMVTNEDEDITFVDLEDIIVLDKHIQPKKDLPNWYKRYTREALGPGFTFSIESLCKHHLSDHNMWAACYVLAGDNTPLLYPIPKEINNSRPNFVHLLNECLNGENRFDTVTKLQNLIDDMLIDYKVIGRDSLR